MNKINNTGTKHVVGIAFGVLGVIFIGNCFTVVTTGSEASVESFGEVHRDKVLSGFNVVAPWWGIDEYNLLLETVTLEDRGIPSQDKFKTSMDISFTGHFLKGYADKIRGTTGLSQQFLDTHLTKKVSSCTIGAGTQVENSQAFFEEKTQSFMTNYVLHCVNDYLKSSEVGGGYELTQVQFTDISLDKVVKRFMVTTKERQEQENQQESQLRIADLKALEVTKVSAANELASRDNKNAAKNRADAKLYAMQQEALGNVELSKSITPQLVKYLEVQQWDGVKPKVVSGNGTGLLLDMR